MSEHVLISTYWNVNMSVCGDELYDYLVLISTYWNVNTYNSWENGEMYAVLISTYWNVNIFVGQRAAPRQHCFNLNLLECKC